MRRREFNKILTLKTADLEKKMKIDFYK